MSHLKLFFNIRTYIYIYASLVAQMVKNLPAMWETQVQSHWRREWLSTLVFSGDSGSIPLEKGMAINSSLLAWKI